jgi:crotonobetainyl-CoA:carnitine CoA-transferase CaiB-like acyl-CoA transferase
MPVARVGEVSLPVRPEPVEGLYFSSSDFERKDSPLRRGSGLASTSSGRTDHQLQALDFSALWAGPYCGGLLAEAGISVTKIESVTRPDPTPHTTPILDARLNGRKSRISMALTDPALIEQIAASNILITSARPHALARLGLTPEALLARNPHLIWVAITAYGWHGDAAMRVGFGDDCAAAGGLVDWEAEEPHFIGDALADPLMGLTAAIAALEALAQGQSGLIDSALAPTAARFAAMR